MTADKKALFCGKQLRIAPVTASWETLLFRIEARRVNNFAATFRHS